MSYANPFAPDRDNDSERGAKAWHDKGQSDWERQFKEIEALSREVNERWWDEEGRELPRVGDCNALETLGAMLVLAALMGVAVLAWIAL